MGARGIEESMWDVLLPSPLVMRTQDGVRAGGPAGGRCQSRQTLSQSLAGPSTAGHRLGAPVNLAVSWVEKVRGQNGVTDGRPMEDLRDIDSLQSFTFM